jgi:hypothetical protein
MADVISINKQKDVYSLAYEALVAVCAFTACTFFLWMFFATTPLERMADVGLITANAGREPRATAYAFAAQWRHGMAGNPPLYMPGFFATAGAVWFWSVGKTLRRILVEAMGLLGIAFVVANILAPFGSVMVLERFRLQTGCAVLGTASSQSLIAAAQAAYTLLTWGTFVVASRFALKLRSFKLLLVPSLLGVVLLFVRPWTVGDLTSLWIRRSCNAEPVAAISLVLVPLVGAFLGLFELNHETGGLRRVIASCAREEGRCR